MTQFAPFPVDPTLTGITIAYRNPSLIADAVLPRVRVSTKEFKYNKYNKDEPFTVPETLVGRKGTPNEVEFTASEESSFVKDYGLDDFIPMDDMTQAAADGRGYDPRGRAVEGITDLILLDREKRVADLVFTKANYASSVATTLSSTSQWSDYSGSNPVTAILEALDTPIMRPNIMVLGNAVWTKLRAHPKVVSAILGNSGTSGIVTRQAVADLFELEEIVVGQGFINTAKRGQTASLSRVWGKHCALLHRNLLADSQRGLTFGFTAQYGERIAGAMPEPKRGLRGGETVRAGESVRELIVSNDSAYFFENAIA